MPGSDLSPLSACETPITIGLSHGGIAQAAEGAADGALDAADGAADAAELGDAAPEHPARAIAPATSPTRR